MAIKPLDKVVITNPIYQDPNNIHFVRKVYNDEEEPEIAIGCYCDLFIEDDEEGVKKVDNEQAVTCEDCLNQLRNL